MTLNSLEYITKETLFSLRRNIWLSIASIVTVMVSLVILGTSAFFLVNTSYMAKDFESQLEISVFIKTETSPQQVQSLESQIRTMPEVSSIELFTKEQALNYFGKTIGSSGILSDLGEVNPLPDKFTIHASDPQQVKYLAEQLAVLPGVDTVRYGQGVVDKLLKFTEWLRWIGFGVILAFSIASIVLISLNIKINVFSRRREIQIMKLVGASNGFIRWPFLVEGLLLGLMGGIFAILIVGFGYQWLIGYIQSTLAFLPIVTDSSLILQILVGLLVAGMGIGAIGSVISLGRFLKV